MVIDAQAIEHLELLEIPGRLRRDEGSFFAFMSQGCATAFGKRLLKRWIVSPLKDVEKINHRLDAVTDFVRNDMMRDKLQAKLKKVPDLERMLSKIYTYSQKVSVKAIYIDVSVIMRLDEFYNLLSILKKVKEIITDVFTSDVIKSLRSKRLKALVTFKKLAKENKPRKKSEASEEIIQEEALFPDITPIIEDFEKMI
jgi:DNA mismatch repair protein MSH6